MGDRKQPVMWSWARLLVGMPSFVRTGQIGDGREAACAAHVEANVAPGDLDGVLDAIDAFAYEKATLVNIGDSKGRLLDAAVTRAAPGLVLELGTYCGYSALRIARQAPSARICSVEFSAANAEVAQRIWRHAGVADRISCIVGTLGDGGVTLDTLADHHGFTDGSVDLVFIDHDKRAYLSDLRSILQRRWLHRGSIVVADNVGIPGAPAYRAYLRGNQGRLWDTVEHRAHVEYQSLLPDLVLESEYLG
ncbi:catechol O-methyltransferase [Mycolicibacterium iranicum]|uniref:Catechol O-methyltransferase n=1 Tax=Mycolicibacterium iranicum TaxID=912594 RepID=A0A839QA21_MYCIR|nr:O-methyltransferase [Mycolicibacterium iranicum]MBB2992810.1 catechol O-methyltransferase [Mycolicibacterium iranicum]